MDRHSLGEGSEESYIKCIHIGLPKTATTMLQTALFPRHSQIEYLGKYVERGSFYRDPTVEALMRETLARPSRPVNLDSCRVLFRNEIIPTVHSKRVIVWSSEDMTTGGPTNRGARARNVRAVFGECKIIIVLRHPLSFVRSMYFQKLKEAQRNKQPWPGTPGSFFEPDWWLEKNWQRPHKAALSNLAYAHTIDIFAESFGRHAIGIFLFEELVEDQAQFMRNLCRFMGIDENEGLSLCEGRRANPQLTEEQLDRIKAISASPIRSLFFRLLPWRIRRELGWLKESPESSPRARFSVSAEWRCRIEDMTREGNRKLVKEWGLPLQKYHYPL